jgi:hypothetical protein
LSGCFSGNSDNIAWIIESGQLTIPQPEPQYYSNAEEADQRIWRHAIMCQASSVPIYSPDTDIYNIGLMIHGQCTKQFIIQINTPSSQQKNT